MSFNTGIFTRVIASVGMVAMMSHAAFADELPATKEVTVTVGDAFIPGGFDSNSDAYVVASGVFPNGCYKWKEAVVTHKTATEHEVRSLATVSSGMCLMVLVPFSKEIRLGKLASGAHTLRFVNDDGTFLEKTFSIE